MNLASFLPEKLPFLSGHAGPRVGAKSPASSKIRRPRFLYVLGFFVFWTVAICLRLVWLAKQIIEDCLARLNGGEKVEAAEIERALGDHVA